MLYECAEFSIINFIAIGNEKPFFISAIDIYREYETGNIIELRISSIIKDYGISKIVQIITDSASNCAKVKKITLKT